MNDLEKLKELRSTVRKCEDTLTYYGKVFREDNEIDTYEQNQLDKLNAMIAKINEEIENKVKDLSDKDKVENLYNTGAEAASDVYNTDDDIVVHSLIDNVPISKLKSKSLDGLKVTVHSAFWTEKLMDMISDNSSISAEELVVEILRINNKDYKDSDSAKHAIANYECSGSLVSVTKGSGGFELTGFTNADLGYAIKFTIYMTVKGFIELKSLEGIDVPKGMQQMGGVPGAAATFVMKYSGFGKLGRALHNYMDGKDPWTGEKASTSGLVIGGITDLLTMGFGGSAKAITGIKSLMLSPAGSNIVLNACQEALENLSPELREELGFGREIFDLYQAINQPSKTLQLIEGISNLIQGGYVTSDLIDKYSEDKK
jgi:hypothetical protein